MSPSISDQVMQFIAAAHDWIAAVALEGYEADGRGMIQVSAPVLPLAGGASMSTNLIYCALDEVRRRLSDLQGASRRDADVLLRIIETYEPSTQAVVSMVIKGRHSISIKMKLERPNVGAKGVH